MYRLLFIFLFSVNALLCQNAKLDSIIGTFKNAKHDSIKMSSLNAWGEQMYLQKPDSALVLWNTANGLAEKGILTAKKGSAEYKSYQKSSGNILVNMSYIYQMMSDLPKSVEAINKALKLLEEVGDRAGVATVLCNLGQIYISKGEIDKAMESLSKSLIMYESLGHLSGTAMVHNNFGFIYDNQGNIQKALEHYTKSLAVLERLNDENGIAELMNNIAFIYQTQGDISKALEYMNKSLKLREKLGNKRGIATSYNNIGIVYAQVGDPAVTSSKKESIKAGMEKALQYYFKSKELREVIGDKSGLANSLNNIGSIYRQTGKAEIALEYLKKALKLQQEIEDRQGICYSLNNIGSMYLDNKKYVLAEEYLLMSLNESKKLGFPEIISHTAQLLVVAYKSTGKYEKALENYELHIKMRDSINNESTRKASIKNQLKYEYEKQAAADSVAHAKESEVKNAQLQKQSVEIKAKKNQQYALFVGLALVIIFAAFMYNRFKITQKQKRIIESQKHLVEHQKQIVDEKQREILDSIHYARRIQMALIPSEKIVASIINRLKK